MTRPSAGAPTERVREADAPLPAELAALLAAQPKWGVSTALNASYGYKDNLLLSFADREQSAFARGSVELLLLRVPDGAFEYSFFGQADRTRYFSAQTVDHDAKVWVRMEPGYRLSESLKLSLPVTGYYYDEVFDVSDTQVERLVAELKAKGLLAGPVLRWDLTSAWWMEAQATGQRERYDDGANDARIGEGALRVGWSRGERLELRLTGAERWRDFDRRNQYSSSGVEQPRTALKIAEREAEARMDLRGGPDRRWRSITRASVLHYADNGSGYFNYREKKMAQEIEWRREPWFVRAGASAGRLDFEVQRVGLGIDPPARLKDKFSADLHVERALDVHWTIFAGYSWERSRSNDRLASYTVNEGLLGVRWSWDK